MKQTFPITYAFSCESKLLKSVCYCSSNNVTGTLTVDFVRGGTYQYQNVPVAVALALLDAQNAEESVGSLFLSTVRNGGYTNTKMSA